MPGQQGRVTWHRHPSGRDHQYISRDKRLTWHPTRLWRKKSGKKNSFLHRAFHQIPCCSPPTTFPLLPLFLSPRPSHLTLPISEDGDGTGEGDQVMELLKLSPCLKQTDENRQCGDEQHRTCERRREEERRQTMGMMIGEKCLYLCIHVTVPLLPLHSLLFSPPPHSLSPYTLSHSPLTSIVVVVIYHPEDDSEDFKDVKWMQHLFYQQDMIGLHWDVQGVGTIAEEPGEGGGERKEVPHNTCTHTHTHTLNTHTYAPIFLFCRCQSTIHLVNCITQIAMVKSPV